MKVKYRIEFSDNTLDTVIICEPNNLDEILKFHFSGEQLAGATVIEVTTTENNVIKHKGFEAFINELKLHKIKHVVDFSTLCEYKGWKFTECSDGILCTPHSQWLDRTPILVTTMEELMEIIDIIERLHV